MKYAVLSLIKLLFFEYTDPSIPLTTMVGNEVGRAKGGEKTLSSRERDPVSRVLISKAALLGEKELFFRKMLVLPDKASIEMLIKDRFELQFFTVSNPLNGSRKMLEFENDMVQC